MDSDINNLTISHGDVSDTNKLTDRTLVVYNLYVYFYTKDILHSVLKFTACQLHKAGQRVTITSLSHHGLDTGSEIFVFSKSQAGSHFLAKMVIYSLFGFYIGNRGPLHKLSFF